MKVKSEIEVAQSCLTLRDPMDCSLPGSSVHEIFQARILEWVATVFSAISSNRSKYRVKEVRKRNIKRRINKVMKYSNPIKINITFPHQVGK